MYTSALTMIQLVLLPMLFQVLNAEIGAYTSFVNIEKLYTLEDELITVSDVLIKHEKNLHGDDLDVHGIYNITSTIEKVKDIHRDVITQKKLTSYLVQPINIYHIVKRLSRDWQEVIAVLEQSKSCSTVMKNKINNMSDNIPTTQHLHLIVRSILRLQRIYNITANDVITGNLTHEANTALSLDDAFDFARVAYEHEHYLQAVDWLKYVVTQFDKDEASFNVTNAMNLMASAFLKLDQPRAALSTLEDVLKIDSSNMAAKRNLKYVMMKIDNSKEQVDTVNTPGMTKRGATVQKFCSGTLKMDKPRTANMFCTYMYRRGRMGLFDRPTVKTEVLSIKPLILVFRDIVNASEQKAVAHLGYEKMRDVMYDKHYMYPNGIDGMTVEDKTYWRWIDNLKYNLDSIYLSHVWPMKSHLLVKNIGMEGYRPIVLDRSERTLFGTFFVFLSEPMHAGGDVIFPHADTRVAPDKGSVVFFERSMTRQMTVCPVLADTEWVGIFHLHLSTPNKRMCYKDILIRPERL